MFKKAERSQSKMRLALMGPSGSGKTYSSLLIAKGLGGKIAMIDTERGSGSLYADSAAYDVCELKPPFTPEGYVQAIRAAENAGYDVLIIDSLSHAWAGEGGILEFVDKATQSLKNNFAAWREASPKHNTLVDAILGAGCHIIVTMRSKTAWEVQKDEKTGKTKPVKIGLAPVQREGLEYEFTAVLELSVDGHVATASKDRTGLFDGQFIVPGVETGTQLKRWLEGSGNGVHEGKSAAETQESEAEAAAEPLRFPDQKGDGNHGEPDLNQLFQVLREVGLSDKIREYEMYLRHKYGCGIRFLTGEQLAEQLANLRQCRENQEPRLKFEGYLNKIKQAA